MGRSSGGVALHAVTVVKPGNPAAGADISYTTTFVAEFMGLAALLTTSATAANRQTQLVITDSAAVILWAGVITTIQTASLAEEYSWSQTPFVSAGPPQLQPGPAGLVLPVGAIIKTVSTNLQVGDQWSALALTLQQAGAGEG